MSTSANPPVEIDPSGLRERPGYLDVADFLRREIALGRLRPGDRLPAERKLAAQLGVARETLRQALKVLEVGGQLRIVRGAAGGPVIQQLVPDAETVQTELIARGGNMIEFTEFRAVVEGAAAQMAAERCGDATIERLVLAQEELAAAVTKAESRLADSAFHLAIAEAADNAMLARAIDDARIRVFDLVDLMPFEFIKESSYAAHQEILDAIRARDPQVAAEAMRAHIGVTQIEFGRVIEGAAPPGIPEAAATRVSPRSRSRSKPGPAS